MGRRNVGALFVSLALAGVSVADEPAGRLLVGAADGARWGLVPPDSMGVSRARFVSVDEATIASLSAGDAVRFDLFPDVSLDGEHERVDADEFGQTFIGSVADGDGRYVIASRAGAMFGVVYGPDGTYEIRPTPGGGFHVVEIDGGALPSCGGAVHAEADEEIDPRAGMVTRGTDCVMIDVLVLYSNNVESVLGGHEQVEALAQAAVSVTNLAYQDSDVSETTTRLRLVHVAQTDYDEGGSYGQHLTRLRATNDGFMDEAHTLRDQYGADMVALLVAAGGACGQAYLMTGNPGGFAGSAFSVTTWSCAVGNYTFAHELGHNMGCAHDRGNAGGAFFSYSYGWRWNTFNGQNRSVMAYSPGSRVGHFSNPDVNNLGQPTGVPIGQANEAHNAATIGFTTPFIENYRARAVTAEDCNADGTPDECQNLPDCNNNGIADACELLSGAATDCNSNGVPDSCDIAFGISEDCDGNGLPDECDIAALDCNANGEPDACDIAIGSVSDDSGQLSPIGSATPQSWTLVDPGQAESDVTITFHARADFSSTNESIEVLLNGASQGFLFQTGANDCPNTPDQAQIVLNTSTFNALLDQGGGDLVIDMVPTFFVDEDTCSPTTTIRVVTTYTSAPESLDVNGDGVPDECQQVPSCAGDLTTTGTGEGDNGFGTPDGVTNLSDLLYFVNVWQADLGTPTPNPGSIADTTTTGASEGSPAFGSPDGDVDLSDLLFFVNEWGIGIGDCP